MFAATSVITANGLHYTQFSNSHATIPLGDWISGRLETQVISPTREAAVSTLSNAMSDSGITINADGTINLLAEVAGLLEFDQIPTVDNSAFASGPLKGETKESVKIKLAGRLLSAAQPTATVKSVSVEIRIPAIGGDVSKIRVMLPDTVGSLIKASDIPTTEFKYSHPGVQQRGGEAPASASNPGGSTGIIYYDEPTGELSGDAASFQQCMYIWNKDTKVGLLIRTDDIKGRGKIFGIVRDSGTNDLIVLVKCAVQDCSIGNSGNSNETLDYSVEFRPMTGDYYDALVYHREQQKLEGHPAFAKEKVRTRIENKTYPTDLRHPSILPIMYGGDRDHAWEDTLGQTPPHPLGGPFNFFERYTQHIHRLKHFFNLDYCEIPSLWYGFSKGVIGEFFPDLDPLHQNAASAIAEMSKLGAPVILYMIPINPLKDVLDVSGLDILNHLAETRSGYDIDGETLGESAAPIEAETAAIAAPEGIVYIGPTWLDDTATDAYFDYIISEMEKAIGVIDHVHVYLDAHNAYAPLPNDNASDGVSDRGFGSKTWTPKNRESIERFRQRLIAKGYNDPIMMTEHPNEFYITDAELLCYPSLTVTDLAPAATLAPSILYSEQVQFSSFAGFYSGPLDSLDFGLTGWADTGEVFAYYYSFYFHQGAIPEFGLNFNLRNDQFILEPGEDGYNEYFVPMFHFYRHVQNWMKVRRLVNHIRKCRMIRPLPSSQVYRNQDAALDGVSTQVDAAKLHTSVWYEEERDILYIMCSNWSGRGSNPLTLTLSDVMTTANYPEIGSIRRNIFHINNGVRLDRVYEGSGDITLDCTLEPEEVGIIAMAPEGVNFVAPEDENVPFYPHLIAQLFDSDPADFLAREI